MDSEDKREIEEELMKRVQKEFYSNNNNDIRLNIAKELLIAQLSNSYIMSTIPGKKDLVDAAIDLTDLLLEEINY